MTRQLSPRSTLDVLKQDAKRWYAALRAADAEATRRLEAAWPGAPEDLTLRDVQHALAREYGQADWKSLRAALEELAIDRQSHAERVDAMLRHGWDGDVVRARRIAARFPEVRRDSVFTAAACGDVDHVRRILLRDAGAAVRTSAPHGWCALAHVAYGRLDAEHAVTIARLLLDAGADPHFRFDDGWGNAFTLITGAIGQGEGAKPTHPQAEALVELFIARGADPFDTQALYNTSIVGDDVAWTECLWTHCQRVGRTAEWSEREGRGLGGRIKVGTLNYLLGNAVSSNHLRRAEWLLAHGAETTTRHAYAQQPVHTMARLAGFTKMAALLARHGAREEPLTGERALLAALMAGDERAVREQVVADPALLHSPHPLHTAAGHGNAAAVRLLLTLGAPIDAEDHDGTTALHRAAHANAVDVIDVLVAVGATVDVRERKWQATPMGWACHLGREQAAERLAPHTRDVRALARSGRVARLEAVLVAEPALASQLLGGETEPTPLFCLPDDDAPAADVVRVLLAHGADPSVQDGRGRTAEQAARLRGLDEAADLLAEPSRRARG
ncbi:MAG: ankyrin repeat domain-containing protein [Gemmatimonas sp.]|jgi:hypothetical protein|uniref:ankyrin repeat domain-containing protein n=1 Tax=Gemmatimonas sp. TaxID=1962908 RepID=UPI00391F2027